MKAPLQFALVVCLLLSGTQYSMAQLKTVAYADGKQKLSGLLAKPASGNPKKAGILILPAWKGIDDHSRKTAEQLATLGYYAFIADIYGKGNYPKDAKAAGEISGSYKKNVAQYQQRIRVALNELVKAGADSGQIVVIGYCFGGTGALEAARVNLPVKGVVSFHGGLGRDKNRKIQTIVPKVLVLHGADDPYVSEEEMKSFQDEMRKANADWQLNYYANAVHAFTEPAAGNDNSKGAAYNEKAAKRSWEAMLIFLAEVLK